MGYEVRQTKIFTKWLAKLKDTVAKVAIAKRIVRLENGNFGDSKFVGGDKSTQEDDIKTAKKMAEEV